MLKYKKGIAMVARNEVTESEYSQEYMEKIVDDYGKALQELLKEYAHKFTFDNGSKINREHMRKLIMRLVQFSAYMAEGLMCDFKVEEDK